jgi:hypothetical protein
MEHDQRVIIRFLWNERIDAYEITHRLQAQFDEYVYALRTVRFWIAEVGLDCQDIYDEIRTGRHPLDDLDINFLAILNKSTFESARLISKTLGVAHSTVLLHSHDSIGFRSFHLHWGPHLLTHDSRDKRKEYAKAMLPFLYAAECDSWHHFVTDDESWFFLNILPCRMWTLSRAGIVDVVKNLFWCEFHTTHKIWLKSRHESNFDRSRRGFWRKPRNDES